MCNPPVVVFEKSEVSKFLKSAGIKHEKGVVKTGVVALIEGNNPTAKTIALRADLDA